MNEVWIMFAVLVGAIAFGVPIPIAVAIGTIVGYFVIDIPFVALAQAMYTRTCRFLPLISFATGIEAVAARC